MRRAIAIGVLAWVALWPFAHRVLVAVYDVNPWKLGGFAMYTSATPPVQVVAFARGAAGGLQPVDERALPAQARGRLRAFRIERHALGELRSPDDVGRALLDALPNEPWVIVAVQRMRLDPHSARLTSTRAQYPYERDPNPHREPRTRDFDAGDSQSP